METTNIKEVVKEKYGEAALRVIQGGESSCCGAVSCCGQTPIRLLRSFTMKLNPARSLKKR